MIYSKGNIKKESVTEILISGMKDTLTCFGRGACCLCFSTPCTCALRESGDVAAQRQTYRCAVYQWSRWAASHLWPWSCEKAFQWPVSMLMSPDRKCNIWKVGTYFQSRAGLGPVTQESRQRQLFCLFTPSGKMHSPLPSLHKITFRDVNKQQAGTLSLILQATSMLENKKHCAQYHSQAHHAEQNNYFWLYKVDTSSHPVQVMVEPTH